MAKKEERNKTQKRISTNVLQFDRIKRTKSGFAIFIGKNVLFLNDGLINYIKNQKAS